MLAKDVRYGRGARPVPARKREGRPARRPSLPAARPPRV